jgi:hypothetical protein
MAKLEYIYEIWQNYSKTRQELEDLLKEKFNAKSKRVITASKMF